MLEDKDVFNIDDSNNILQNIINKKVQNCAISAKNLQEISEKITFEKEQCKKQIKNLEKLQKAFYNLNRKNEKNERMSFDKFCQEYPSLDKLSDHAFEVLKNKDLQLNEIYTTLHNLRIVFEVLMKATKIDLFDVKSESETNTDIIGFLIKDDKASKALILDQNLQFTLEEINNPQPEKKSKRVNALWEQIYDLQKEEIDINISNLFDMYYN